MNDAFYTVTRSHYTRVFKLGQERVMLDAKNIITGFMSLQTPSYEKPVKDSSFCHKETRNHKNIHFYF